ncbi:MAG: hypothetical protein CXR30_16435 [Geobacter sp.]|nr:MAG: hypothetical protein CXR30_16435 [Geobacter sp.]
MKVIWSEKIDTVLSCGQPLFQIGINNWALTKEDALLVLDKLLEIQVPILGGDVYHKNGETFHSNYDNWYCDQIEGELNSDYVTRSIDVARQYIINYQVETSNTVYFALIPE